MLKIYLTDLAAYNKGFLFGEWISLPMDDDELSEAINKVLRGGEAICAIEYGYEEHEEWFVTDFEWDDIDLCEVSEYEDIFKLNKSLQGIVDAEPYKLKAMGFLLSEGIANDIEDAFDKADDVIIYENQSLEDVAYDLMQECYNADALPSIIANHIDYEGIARDLEIEGAYTVIGNDVYEYHS